LLDSAFRSRVLRSIGGIKARFDWGEYVRRILSVTWFALRAVQEDLIVLSGVGLAWFGLTVLLPYVSFWLVSSYLPVAIVEVPIVLVALLPAAPATAGLYVVAQRIVRGQSIKFVHYWSGFKSYLVPSWKLGALILASGAILAFDLWFYLGAEQIVYRVIGFVGLWALLFWLLLQIYLFPLMVHQEDLQAKVVVKNAAMLVLAYPLFSLGILIVVLAATALSVLLLLVLVATVWMPFVAVLSSKALVSRLEAVEEYRQQRAGQDTG